jgi:uncharacterized protein (DUF1697 family)
MTTNVALFRAVNLPAHNKVSMEDLRRLFEGLGLESPRSLLQTGNLVFRSRLAAGKLEGLIEKAAAEELGLETDVFVRTAVELTSAIERNPFPGAAKDDPSHLLVMFLRDTPGRSAVTALRGAIKGRETVEVAGRHAYVVYPDGIGRSRLTTALIEKHLGTRGTGRNWNTILKLAAMAGEG